MKFIQHCLLLFAVISSSLAVHAQTADEVIAKHLEAIGGKEKLGAITSVKMTNTNTVMGNEAPATVLILNGKGFRSEAEVMGSKMIQVFTDKGGWMVNPMMGSSDPQELPAEQAKAGQAQIFAVPLLNYAANGAKAEYVGQEKLGAINAYKLKLIDKNGEEVTFFFDPATYYLIQTVRSAEMMGQKVEVTTTFSDFKKTDFGWVVPQTTEINMGQFAITSKLKNIEVNVPVDAAVFEIKK
ncbi:outer membrane lipoprotein-sorting protein [Flavisolibacter nicotianae]|uniref:outer membrane lipoprotein-sorting protein n=1 Tax=Flavisolibacter nicotianae TaxID=2364882 RepID=UPI000EB31BC3|nr:outer membrane lipoprotein-sorting protein [Flavisolibacter nicotianae]